MIEIAERSKLSRVDGEGHAVFELGERARDAVLVADLIAEEVDGDLLVRLDLRPLEEASAADGEARPETRLLEEERNRQLYAALDRIAPEYREVLLLQYMEDMAPADIARVTGRRVKQVYNLIDRGKLALRSELERMGFTYEAV